MDLKIQIDCYMQLQYIGICASREYDGTHAFPTNVHAHTRTKSIMPPPKNTLSLYVKVKTSPSTSTPSSLQAHAMADSPIPPWVPEISPGQHADVYPVSPPQQPPELVLDKQSLTHGYAERRLPYEFSSHISPRDSIQPISTSDITKLRNGLTQLRRSPPSKVQRLQNEEVDSGGGGKAFPLQKSSASSSLEDWFNRLASHTYSLETLARGVPLGPAIVRAAGKVIEMMAVRNVPAQRAVWYIRIAVLNECMRQIRPDRPPLLPKSFWTRRICELLRTEIDAIRARKTAILGSLERVVFWEYVLGVLRWQADEGLLDVGMWCSRVAAVVRAELLASQSFAAPGTKIALMAARRFLPEFVQCVDRARLLVEALLPGASGVVKAWRASVSTRDGRGRGGARKGKRGFVQNACHAEMALLLAAGLRGMQVDVAELAEVRVSDLEKLVRKGVELLHVKEGKKKEARILSADDVVREMEMLGRHGDIARVVKGLREVCGGWGDVVRRVSEWVVEGPVCDRAEAVCSGGAILTAVAEAVKNGGNKKNGVKRVKKGVHQQRGVTGGGYVIQRDVWQYIKSFAEGREEESAEKDLSVVRFVACLCRLDLMSLPTFVRDVSRLASCAFEGTRFLVKVLSLLPDPVDRSIADCRRALLRKFGYVTSGGYEHGVGDACLAAALGGDVRAVETETEKLASEGNTNVILSTTEAVRLEDVAKLQGEVGRKLFSMASFFVYAEEPGIAVDWLVDLLSDLIEGMGDWKNTAMAAKRQQVAMVLVRLAEDLSRYVSASGQMESLFLLFKRAWVSSWVSAPIRKQILHTQAHYCRHFGPRSGSTSSNWTRLVVKHLRQLGDGPKTNSLLPFAVACMRGKDEMPTSGAQPSMTDVLNTNTRENLGLTPDEDLSLMLAMTALHKTKISELRGAFRSTQSDFDLDAWFAVGFTANDIFGALFIPVLRETVNDTVQESYESTFAKLAQAALQLISSRQTDVRLQGVRPGLLLEFLALMIAGCLCEHTEPATTLEILAQTRWVWKILSPHAGIDLAKRLRTRVDYYCDTVAVAEKRALSATLFNMVTRFSGETERDEAIVANALGSEPFGMIEMQLSLLAVHRRETGEDEEFGSRISEAAISLICKDSAKTLVNMALRCCDQEESRHVVAGLVGYAAGQAMVESLEYVVTGLTVDAAKNTDLHRERAEQWYQADTARRCVLECAIESLSQEVGVQVESVLFEQLVAATSQLTAAQNEGTLPSSLLRDGRRISDALESRLQCILRSQRTPQGADVWRARTLQIASLLKSCVCVLTNTGVLAAANVLNFCIRSLGEAGNNTEGETRGNTQIPVTTILDHASNRDVKRQLEASLTPVLLWLNPPERDAVAKLIPHAARASAMNMPVVARKADGSDVDNWVLLEGYGRNAEEESALSPNAYWRQGDTGFSEDVVGVVHLKRTYSTFASLAV